MADADKMLGMYLHLARASHVRRRLMIRDKLLVLAGVQAHEMGLAQISALCRQRILSNNAHHLVRRWPTLDEALSDARFQSYLKQLRRRYSREKTEHILHSLGIELGRERETYLNDLEYAAALLDVKPEAIDDLLARRPKPARSGNGSPAAVEPPTSRSRRSRRSIVLWLLTSLTLLALLAIAWLTLVRRD